MGKKGDLSDFERGMVVGVGMIIGERRPMRLPFVH